MKAHETRSSEATSSESKPMAKHSSPPERRKSPRKRLTALGTVSLGALMSSLALAQTPPAGTGTAPAASAPVPPAPAPVLSPTPVVPPSAASTAAAAPSAPATSAPTTAATDVAPPSSAPATTPPSPSAAPTAGEPAADPSTEADRAATEEQQIGTEFGTDGGDALVLGLSPGAPQITSLPGGVTPAFGQESTSDEVWRFDFHGLVFLPLRIGIGERERALVGQKTMTLHGPPLVPGHYESFEYTGTLPDPWVQLNFSYGNKDVTATVIVAARTVNSGESYFNPPDHIGINDAFLTYRYPISRRSVLSLNVGAFAHNYGNLGEYDLGKFGTPLIARVGGSGLTVRGDFELSNSVVLLTELGFFGQLNKAPVGTEPAGWNGYADPNVGSSFASHGHVVGYFDKTVAIGAHSIHAFVQDDRATPLPQNTDGAIDVLGFDARLMLREYGHLYLGFAQTWADQARAVSGIVRVLNAPGGPGLMKEYFGPDSNNGTGSLTTLGAQYDLSFGHYLRLKERTVGEGPDLVVSPFAMMTMVGSDDGTVDEDGRPLYDDITKLKYGLEVTHGWFSWLAGSIRYDRVVPDMDDSDETFAAISPRLIFSSDWGSQDQVVLQYSKWFNGSQSAVYSGSPPEKDPTIVPDGQSIMLSASMWW